MILELCFRTWYSASIYLYSLFREAENRHSFCSWHSRGGAWGFSGLNCFPASAVYGRCGFSVFGRGNRVTRFLSEKNFFWSLWEGYLWLRLFR